MVSQTSEHAIRAVLYLAQKPAGAAVSADAIADALGAPRNYLSKTLNLLAKEGILASMRGPTGGFRLEVPPARLTLEAVIRPFDEPRVKTMCLLGGRPCTDEHPCDAHFRWKAVSEEMWAPLRETTVSDLLGRGTVGIEIAGIRAGIPHQAADAV